MSNSSTQNITIGTRGSKLALWQANFVRENLEQLGHTVIIKIIKTRGDKIQDIGFDKIEGKGFFTKELEDALLQSEVDLAVHSMKDMQTSGPEDLVIAAVSKREAPNDLLILHPKHTSLQGLQNGNPLIIGTSSARRKAQIQHLFPNVIVKDLRGNVPTRISKLTDEHYDGIILAKAGINRLEINLEKYFTFDLQPSEFVPAPAQGVMAIQTRKSDTIIRTILKNLHHPDVSRCTNIERSVLKSLDGGCQLPLGVFVNEKTRGSFTAHVAFKKEDKPLIHFQITQSTYIGLTDKILEKINAE